MLGRAESATQLPSFDSRVGYSAGKEGSRENTGRRIGHSDAAWIFLAELLAMSKNRRKAEAENRARLDRHSNEKAIATRQANHQREVALGRERLDGLFPVRMPSLLEEMDSHEVTSRGGLPRHYTTQPPAFVPRTQPPAFVPPRFQPSLVREIETMSYTSPHIVNVRKLGSKGKQQLALALPPDIVEAIGFEHLASMRFSVELDEGGMTFRAGGGGRPIAVPTWATKKVGAR